MPNRNVFYMPDVTDRVRVDLVSRLRLTVLPVRHNEKRPSVKPVSELRLNANLYGAGATDPILTKIEVLSHLC